MSDVWPSYDPRFEAYSLTRSPRALPHTEMFGEGGEVEGGEPWHGSAQERSLLISCMAENDALRMELQQS